MKKAMIMSLVLCSLAVGLLAPISAEANNPAGGGSCKQACEACNRECPDGPGQVGCIAGCASRAAHQIEGCQCGFN